MSFDKTKYNISYPVVVFFPDHEYCNQGYLCGEVVIDTLLKTKNYFIHDIHTDIHCVPEDVIGVIGNTTLSRKRKKQGDWIKVKMEENMPLLVEIVSDNTFVKRSDCQLIVYNQQCFIQSELLLSVDFETNTCLETIIDDHFKSLVYNLKQRQTYRRGDNGLQPIIKFLLARLISSLQCIDRFISMLFFMLKISNLAIHMSTFIKNAIWGLELIYKKRGFTTLKSGNYILGLIGDWIGGLLFIYWLVSLINIEEVLHLLATQSEVVVVSLKNMVRYLMGSPADLKLNGPLNNVLGKFFLFHIDLWWAFLGYARPMLELGFKTFICLGSLGLSFQIAILADLLAVASFHVYIIYVYAARLYNAQVMGLMSLSRVFLGRKRNPLPGRVDSCPYSTEQLLIGTIAFTVLLFLLPTTLVYYIVFTAIRLVLIVVGGVLTQARFVLSSLPLYCSLLWLLDSPATTSCVRLTPKMASEEEFVLMATPVQSSWWQTVRACTPDHLCAPPPVNWGELCFHLLTGRLVYPV